MVVIRKLPPTEDVLLTPTTVTLLCPLEMLRLLGDTSGPLEITALVVTVEEVGVERAGLLGFPSSLSSPAAAAVR